MEQFLDVKRDLPTLGVGLGLRRELAGETFEHTASIDWLELVPENYMGLGGKAEVRLERARSLFPLVTHGVNLSLGSTDELNPTYLKEIKALLDLIDAPWWSDHLCFTSVNGAYMHDLLPLPFSKEAVKHLARRIRAAQEFVGRPLLIENISFYMYMPGNEMTEAQFISEILEQADCGLLLDVNNVYVNSINHNFDPYKFLDSIPIERTVQMHLAGHAYGDEMIIDTHGAPVIEPVYELLEYILRRTEVKAVMLERDQNYPAFSEIIGELNQVRTIARHVQPELLSGAKTRLEQTTRAANKVLAEATVSSAKISEAKVKEKVSATKLTPCA